MMHLLSTLVEKTENASVKDLPTVQCSAHGGSITRAAYLFTFYTRSHFYPLGSQGSFQLILEKVTQCGSEQGKGEMDG